MNVDAVASASAIAAARSESRVLVLHTAAGRVGAMDVGCTTEGGIGAALDGADVVCNLGADEIDVPDGPFVIYQGSHGDRGAHRADVILPAAAWTEENGLFVNTEGRPQLAVRAAFPPGDARENWAILRAVSGQLGTPLPYDNLAALRQALVAAHPHLAEIDLVPANEPGKIAAGDLGTGDFAEAVSDHDLVNPVCRASELMAELSSLARARNQPPMAAE
jgi:NADH-quinone oxidoreductase subunit G